MKLAKLRHDPGALAEFFRESLESLGALCERTWHNRLQVVAEGNAARLWNPDGQLVEKELCFPSPDETAPRQAESEVFPGCPLTFRLAETLGADGLTLNRAVLQETDKLRAPTPDVAERLWRLQFPATSRWRQESNFAADWHCSLIALVRCEIQAIEQHWSLHRLAVSLPDGEPDGDLAQNVGLLAVAAETASQITLPAPDPTAWQGHLQRALEQDLASDLAAVLQRQENYLRRELDRVDDYFENYIKELTDRVARSRSFESKTKLAERCAAARAEHERRRADQVQRHELRVIPHLDALLLLAEPAWRVTLLVAEPGEPRRQYALWVPRTRRWSLADQAV
jgi:hypothetical protein